MGLENSWSKLHEIGVETINLAGHYHSVRALQLHLPEDLFVSKPEGCYFDLASEQFDDLLVLPIPNDVPGLADPGEGNYRERDGRRHRCERLVRPLP